MLVPRDSERRRCPLLVSVAQKPAQAVPALDAVHHLCNPGMVPLELIKVYGEDDIMQFGDVYGIA